MKMLAMISSMIDRVLMALWGLEFIVLLVHRQLASVILISIGVFALMHFVVNPAKRSRKIPPFQFFIPVGLFIIYLLAFLRGIEEPNSFRELEQKFAFIGIPLIWILSDIKWATFRNGIGPWLIYGVSGIGLIMLGESLWTSLSNGEVYYLYYDRFMSPFNVSPIYFSYFASVALFWPIGSQTGLMLRVLSALKWFLLGLILLSASKLFSVLAVLLFTASRLRKLGRIKFTWKWGLAIVLVVAFSYPVIQRFDEIGSPDIEFINQDQYSYDSPFDGLTIRLVQWRLGWEIMQENEWVWINGLTPALSQEKLDEKYIEHGIYMGNPELGDSGYKGYNYHNQFVEILLSVGLVGLTFFLIWVVSLIAKAIQLKGMTSVIIVSVTFALTESMLERELGIVMFMTISTALFYERDVINA